MAKIQVNLLSDDEKSTKNVEKQRVHPTVFKISWKKITTIVVAILIILLLIGASSIAFFGRGLINIPNIPILGSVSRLVDSGDRQLKGESEDRINFLIIGIGGRQHEGGTLADTIMLASLKPSNGQIALMSLPRDLLIPTPGQGQMKINAITAYAEMKEAGSGAQALAEEINWLLDTEINYYTLVDFDGFEKIIDEFGGVDVNVERDLTDYQYPIRGKENVYPIENRFEILKIKAGEQHFDGETALKYARSRHALGIEGSDFARSERQKKIILALKEKVISFNTIVSPKRIGALLNAYQEHIETNMQLWEMIRLAELVKNFDISNVTTQALSDAPDGLLYANMINGAYVLLPNDQNFNDIKNVWHYIFYKEKMPAITTTKPNISFTKETTSPSSTTSTVATTTNTTATTTENHLPTTDSDYATEGAKIEIRNGTWTTGYAGSEKIKLENMGLDVVAAGNAASHDYGQTIIYDLTENNPKTADKLAEIYNASIKTPSAAIADSSAADFLIILGQK